jgi:hypothetical protein
MFTPYAAHKIVNNTLKAAGFDFSIPPQMMYNYTSGKVKAGKKPLIKFDSKNGIDKEDFERWLGSYMSKKIEAREEAKKETEVEVVE